MPDDKANYLHRIGRVGRAKKMGLAISLVSTVKVNFLFFAFFKQKSFQRHVSSLFRHFQVRKLILVPRLYSGDVLETFEKTEF